jgi:putative phosphoribosyl transferase
MLATYADRGDLIVLALPRGGVAVGYEVARMLRAPLDVFFVRPLCIPGLEDQVFGMIGSVGTRLIDDEAVANRRVPDRLVAAIEARERFELERQERIYRGMRPEPIIRGRTVILIDDGLTTESSWRAAVSTLRQLEPARLVVAVPIVAASTLEAVRHDADEFTSDLSTGLPLIEGLAYQDVSPMSDSQIRLLLRQSWAPMPAEPRRNEEPVR